MPPIATISPNPIAFGSVRLGGMSIVRLLSVKNTGDSDLGLVSITLTGPFILTNVTRPPSSLVGPGAEFLFKLFFTPDIVGPRTGILTIRHTAAGSPATINLSGTGIIGGNLDQERKLEWVGPKLQQFDIINAFTQAGDMPDTFIFVKQIVLPLDPKADLFKRVARIVDITTLPKGRNAGLVGDPKYKGEYLASVVQLSYGDLGTAVAAQDVIKNQVSQLIKDWIVARDKFLATPVPESIPLPAVEQLILKDLINAYTAAKINAKLLNDELANTQKLIADQQAILTDQQGQLTQMITFNNGAISRTSEIQTFAASLTTFIAAANLYLSQGIAAGVATFNNNVFTAAITAATTALAAANTATTNHQTYQSSINTYALTVSGKADTTALYISSVAILALKKEASDALAAEAAALAAVLAVCPDFDPTSVCAC